MRKYVLALALSAGTVCASTGEKERWREHVKNVTITRDDFGIAHVVGKSDADAVFGSLFAQAEDDFHRIEVNYLTALGRLSEAEGKKWLWQDLRAKLFVDEHKLKTEFNNSPKWLRKLMVALADGLNYYLHVHPQDKPAVIKHFEPWMALAFSEGSIGGDIERVNLTALQNLYQEKPIPIAPEKPIGLGGSNGIAIAPSKSASGNALLLINPHTSFYFRTEIQMTSDEGLNAYGAVTWGQFFVYQGFNEKIGWMHSSSTVDAIDEYIESNIKPKMIKVNYKTPFGLSEQSFETFYSKHGPIVRKSDNKLIAVQIMHKPADALMQSFLRMKTTNMKSYRENIEHHKANSSNNTTAADSEGNIAFFYPDFVPKRDAQFDWTQPVEGDNPKSDWMGGLQLNEIPVVVNPKMGWVCNTNNWPWSVAGEGSLKKSDYPPYIDSGIENARGKHALSLLKQLDKIDLDGLIALAYDSHLNWFTKPLKALFAAFEKRPHKDLNPQIDLLRKWDQRYALDSIATSLAVFWGQDLIENVKSEADRKKIPTEDYISSEVQDAQLIESLERASKRLINDFGTWRVAWGEINRYQRLTGDIRQAFSDAKPSTPIPYAAGTWGALAAFYAKPYEDSKRAYGVLGNSFVAVVEFGKKVRAKALLVGGQSGHRLSKHFDDQVVLYAQGKLRDVYFYQEQLKGHTERTYHPGQ